MSDPNVHHLRAEPAGRSHDAASLAAEALRLSGDLVRKEIALGKAEITRNLHRAAAAVGAIAAAAVVGIVAINVLVAALVAALAETDLGPIWSAIIVGVVLALLAYILLRQGLSNLSAGALMPSRTAQNVQRDAQTIREAYRAK